jgi:predicted RNA-binding Zn-ribbon protein involved in translation (DUF1610 family)
MEMSEKYYCDDCNFPLENTGLCTTSKSTNNEPPYFIPIHECPKCGKLFTFNDSRLYLGKLREAAEKISTENLEEFDINKIDYDKTEYTAPLANI